MRRQLARTAVLLFCLLSVLFAAGPARAQVIYNGPEDLSGKNMGDFVLLWWSDDPSSTAYVMYRSANQTGPWQEIGRMQADVSIISGAKVDYTPDARLMTLCYKVDALDAAGRVIRTYQPMCIPKYAEKK